MKISEVMLTMAAFVVIVAGMKSATTILVPFLLAAFIAIMSAAPMFWLQGKRVPQGLALVIVLVVIVAILTLVVALIGTSVAGFTQDLPSYQQKIRGQTTAFITWLDSLGLDTKTLNLEQTFDPGAAMRLAGTMLNSLRNVLTNGFLILMTVIFMLLEAAGVPEKIQAMIGDPEASLARWEHSISNVKQYVAIKTWFSLITGGVIAVWLIILGVDYALLWGLLAFAFNFVPNIGSIMAAIPAVLLALVQAGLTKALVVTGGYLVVNITISSFIEPRFMGRGLGLSTLVVFLSLIFWGWVLGPVGMLLSVPLTMTFKIVMESRDDTRWLAVLLGTGRVRPVVSDKYDAVPSQPAGEEPE